jgi:hypothetical protein
MYQFDKDDYENELRFHLQYCMFTNRISSAKKFMTHVFEDIINRFLDQSGDLRKLYASCVLGIKPEEYKEIYEKEEHLDTDLGKNIEKGKKFYKFFYETKTKELAHNIIQDVTDLYDKVSVEYREMGRIINDIIVILNPELTDVDGVDGKRPKTA